MGRPDETPQPRRVLSSVELAQSEALELRVMESLNCELLTHLGYAMGALNRRAASLTDETWSMDEQTARELRDNVIPYIKALIAFAMAHPRMFAAYMPPGVAASIPDAVNRGAKS